MPLDPKAYSMFKRFLCRRCRPKTEGRISVTYVPKGTPVIMNPNTVSVPPASSGLVARVTYDLLMKYGEKKPADGAEVVSFATGGVITAKVNADGTVDYQAVGETGSDTATITDEGQTITTSLEIDPDAAVGEEQEGTQYVAATPAAPAEGAAEGATE